MVRRNLKKLGHGVMLKRRLPREFGNNIRSRAVDDSGNLEIPTAGVSVTVTAAVCPCNLWNRTLTPTNIDADPDNSVELGMKFKADLNGSITGIRFYKSSNNTGTHVGSLWNSSGALWLQPPLRTKPRPAG